MGRGTTFTCFFSILILIGTLATSVRAENTFVAIGGSGDAPDLEKTIFDETFKSMGQSMKTLGWKGDLYFNGGHPKSEEDVYKYFDSGVRSKFNPETYKSGIKKAEERIDAAEAGDQVLFWVDSHGRPADKDFHDVECGDSLCSLEKFNFALSQSIAQKLRGPPKIAVVDNSCYSGSSIKFAQEAVCAVSAAGDSVSSSDFGIQLTQSMRKGFNLEEAFLRARLNSKGYGTPQISTPAGLIVQERMRKLLANVDYLGFRKELPEDCCTVNVAGEIKEIVKALGSLNEQLKSWLEESQEFKNLIAALRDYKKLFDEARKKADELNRLGTEKRTVPIKGEKGGNVWVTWNAVADDLENQHTEKQIKDLENSLEGLKDPKNPNHAYYGSTIKGIQSLEREVVARDIVGKNPEFQDFLNKRTAYLALVGAKKTALTAPLSLAAKRVWELERTVYEQMYRAYQTQEPNPCNSFKF
jgi:hypothetical protein